MFRLNLCQSEKFKRALRKNMNIRIWEENGMSLEKVKEYFRTKGIEERIQEFEVSSATVALAAKALPL